MCGIIYGESFDGTPVNNYILNQYDKQKSRGQQGFGVFDGVNNHLVHTAEEDRILNWLVKEKNQSELLLMHHRFPTSTVNVRRAAHPFTTKNYFGDTEYVLVHNGMIRNSDELFVAHQELGIDYYSLLDDLTFNDSEALLWDFALYMEGRQKEIVAAGAIAFICLKLVKGKLDKMYFARNTNPLNMIRDKTGLLLSSEGEGEPIKPNTLHTYNYGLKRLTTKPLWLHGFVYTGEYASGQYAGSTNWEDDYEDDYQHGYSRNSVYDLASYNYPDWVPEDTRRKFDRHLENEVMEVISHETIKRVALDYLDLCHGNFEIAYWTVEDDYDDLLAELDTIDSDTRWQIRLLEKVMDQITNDPEYLNEESVSSEWRNVWQQQQLSSQ